MLSQEGNDIIFLIIRLFVCIDNITARYSSCEVCIHTGIMLRECIRCHGIHESMLSQPSLIKPLFCIYPYSHHFDVSCDVLYVLRDMLRRHRSLVATLLRPDGALFPHVPSSSAARVVLQMVVASCLQRQLRCCPPHSATSLPLSARQAEHVHRTCFPGTSGDRDASDEPPLLCVSLHPNRGVSCF